MTIVFGTTLRPGSETLAETAGMLAQKLGVPLRLVHVAEDPRAPVVLGTDEEHILGSLRGELEREAKRVESLIGVAVQPHLAAGAVAEALTSVAEFELAASLIVGAGTQRSRSPLGGVAERVSRKSRVPVLTLRSASALSSWLCGERSLKVLVGADRGRAATAARAFAATLQRRGALRSRSRARGFAPGDPRAARPRPACG